MTFAQTRSPQSHTLSATDVCKMPPAGAPLPIPNVALFSMAKTSFNKVMIMASPVFTMADKILLSSGNEASLAFGGGVVSGKAIGSARAVAGSSKVFMGGNPQVRMSDMMMHNNDNAPGNTLTPAQTKVMVLS